MNRVSEMKILELNLTHNYFNHELQFMLIQFNSRTAISVNRMSLLRGNPQAS